MLPARLAAPGYEQTSEHVARLARLTINGAGPEQIAVASVPVPGGVVEILGGAGLDRGAQVDKLRTQLTDTDSEIVRAEGKLANQGFVAKAPPQVVQAERDKVAQLRSDRERLVAELAALGEDVT